MSLGAQLSAEYRNPERFWVAAPSKQYRGQSCSKYTSHGLLQTKKNSNNSVHDRLAIDHKTFDGR
jgi:hypothetical protein